MSSKALPAIKTLAQPSAKPQNLDMRILQIGYAQLRRFGDLHAGSEYKLYFGLIRNNHNVIHFSDRDIAAFLAPFKMRDLGKGIANRKLIETADNFQPDLILLGHCDIVTNQTLEQIRKLVPQVKIAYRNLDPLFVPRNVAAIQHRAEVIDSIFVTTAGPKLDQFRGQRASIHYMPNPCDPSIDIYDNSLKDDLPIDLFFCGNSEELSIRKDTVEYLLDQLQAEPIHFKAFGYRNEPNSWGYDYDQLLGQVKMGLNLNRQEGDYLYSSDRLAQLMGNGILALIHDSSSISELVGAEHAVFFKDQEDLRNKIIELHADDARRKAIAAKGRSHYIKHFNSQRVSQYIVERTLGLPLSEDYIWAEL